jgi:hypothetical protein
METCKCCGSVITDNKMSDFLNSIMLLIEEDGLNTPSRSPKLNHKRYYLFNKMRERGLSLQKIGEYFNRNHSTIIHGIKMHKIFLVTRDKIYLKDTEEYDNLFQINQ